MIIKSKYSKSFVSDSISESKYNELYSFAELIKEHKNKVAIEVNSNLQYYMDLSFFDFLKLMRSKYSGIINSNFDKQLYQDVFVSYENKFDAIQKKIAFEKTIFKGIEYYKKDTKKNKKGDFKKYNISKEKTKLTIVLSYLSRYGSESTLTYINNQLSNPNLDENKIKLFNNVLYYSNKFGFDRLLTLALNKRDRIISFYSRNPVTFKKLTFRGRSRLTGNIISYNENFNSKINAFINISWLGRGKKLSIPVKYSSKYHGSILDYKKETPDYEYLVVFERGKVKINICKDGDRYYPENKNNYIGFDVNVKNNLFALSNGETFDYNRGLLNELALELGKIDELKKDKNYLVGKKKQRKLDSMRNKIKKSNETLCSSICKYLNENGYDHIVMEDLDNGFGKSFVKDKDNNNLNFNRIVKELKISSLKGMLEHIGRKYDISLSTVQSSYTSKACSNCGCIADENRPNQETFSCIECGYENNADINAAINIENRVSSTVLRSNLLKQTKIGNGTWEPKSIKRDKVKSILLSLRHNLPNVNRDMVNLNRNNYI